MCFTEGIDDQTRILQLLLLHSVYAATDCLRFDSPVLGGNSMHELLMQYIQQGAAHSSTAQQALRQAVAAQHAKRPRLEHIGGQTLGASTAHIRFE